MPDFVSGTPIGPEHLAAHGTLTHSPGGAKELHVDSSAQRSAFESQFGPVQADQPGDASAEEILPPDIMAAMAAGKPPTPTALATLAASVARAPANSARTRGLAPIPAILADESVHIMIPLGGGITARIAFSGEPKARHWKKLIRHLEIEADSEPEPPARAPIHPVEVDDGRD